VFEYASRNGLPPQIWIADVARGGMQPYTFDGGNFTPVFSPDGAQVMFTREDGGRNQDLWTLRADAPGSQRLIVRMPLRFNTTLGLSPDGSGVLLRTQGTHTRQDLIYVNLRDTTRIETVLGTRFNEPTGAISPDGRWLAYVSDESGRFECRVRAFPSGTGQVTVVSRGASGADPTAASRIGLPVWRRDGRELLFVGADGRTLVTVAVTPGDPPAFGEPQPLFRLANSVADMVAGSDLDRFILSIIREEEGRSAAILLLDWPGLLEGTK
jgi:Tol biopolymer transport system component